ncbi:hypothetical protein C0995_004928, partial [Termitomyces sp. Mi166
IENGMSSLGDELTNSLMQAEEQIEQIEQMFHGYKVNIKNLHGHVDDLGATVSAPSPADKQLTRLSNAKSTMSDKSASSPADAISPPMQQSQASPLFPIHPSSLAPILEEDEAAGSALPSASRGKSASMSGIIESVLNSHPTSAAATGSAPNPDPTAMATIQSAPSAKSSPSVANPSSVPPTTTATMTLTTECGLILSATTATMAPTTECGQRLLQANCLPSEQMQSSSQLAGKHKANDSGEEPESKQMKDRE